MSIGYNSPLPGLPAGYETPEQERQRAATREEMDRAQASEQYLPTATLVSTGESLWGDTYLPYPKLWKSDGAFRKFEDGPFVITGASWATERNAS
jgi:hypothetical protein